MQHSRELSFHNEIHFRNSLVDCLTQWVSGDLCTTEYITHEDNLKGLVYDCLTHSLTLSLPPHSELDLSAMRAVGTVLSGLPLQPRDSAGDIVEAKSKLFLK